MKESLSYVTEMEEKMSKLTIAHPELKDDMWKAPKKPEEMPQSLRSSEKNAGIANSLELSNKLKEHWYPVEFSSKLATDALLPLELFGEKWVLFR